MTESSDESDSTPSLKMSLNNTKMKICIQANSTVNYDWLDRIVTLMDKICTVKS